jgi:hypothetical protein
MLEFYGRKKKREGKIGGESEASVALIVLNNEICKLWPL